MKDLDDGVLGRINGEWKKEEEKALEKEKNREGGLRGNILRT